MTLKAERFLEANKRSGIVYGSATTCPRRRDEAGDPLATGVYYRLADGQTFTLGRKDLAFIPAVRWVFELEAA